MLLIQGDILWIRGLKIGRDMILIEPAKGRLHQR